VVQVLGPDLFSGTDIQLTQFETTTGATFPLLLNGGTGTGNENLFTVFGDRDNYAVINKVGIVRYNAYDSWPYGNRFHLGELRATIDSLVSSVVAVEGNPSARGLRLTATPNPFRAATSLELINPAGFTEEARVSVFDLAGREVASLWRAAIPPGATRMSWDGRASDGSPVGPGVYMVRAQVGHESAMRRVLLLK
jgi:hypothetical protein